MRLFDCVSCRPVDPLLLLPVSALGVGARQTIVGAFKVIVDPMPLSSAGAAPFKQAFNFAIGS